MARHSQTEVAVLGALSTGPMTGYEVRRAITEVLGHFWHESYGQIYPCLAALEQSGSVRRTGPGRTSGTVFQITPAGQDQLRKLLAEPHATPPARNGLLLRLFFGAHLADGAARNLLEQARDRARRALEEYASVRDETGDETREESGDGAGRERALRAITLSFGEHVARAQIAWAQESLETLAALDAHRAKGTTRARG
ncbi:MAG TPA: PadR family transcriptional regulator [Ornithinibacter sp.]|nr:PadR family transcriptional regulator [Ornithinibacter sp.]